MPVATSRRPAYLVLGGVAACLAIGGLLLWLVPGNSEHEASSTSTVAPTSATTSATKLAPKYSARLEAARTTPCDGAAMFSTDCGLFMLDAKKLGTEVAQDADRLGSAYGEVALAGRAWASAADQWVTTCMPSEAGSSTRVSCLKVLPPATTGAEGVLAAIYDVESR